MTTIEKTSPRRYTDERSGLPAVGRPLPSDLHAERAFLGALMTHPDAITEIEPWFNAGWLSQQKHLWIYEAILACVNQTPPLVPDPICVGSMMRHAVEGDADHLTLVGGVTFLSDLAASVPTPGSAEGYARFIRETAVRRQLIETSGKIAACGYDERQPLEESLAQAEETLHLVTDTRSTEGVVKLGDVMSGIFEEETQRHNGEDEQSAVIPTPFTDLNRYLGGGLRRGDMTIVAARPGVGKTAFAQTIALDVARKGLPVLFFSLEMSQMKIGYRFLSMQTGLSTQALQAGTWLDEHEQLAQVVAAMGELSNLEIYLDARTEQPVATVRSVARQVQRRVGALGLIVVDYLQLLRYVVGNRRMEFRVHEVTEVAQALKATARQLEVPVLALAQLNRAVEGRVSRIPMLSDLRESGGIEQAADQVLFLYREELYEKETSKKGVAEVHIAKNRDGRLGMVPLAFHEETTAFRNLAVGR